MSNKDIRHIFAQYFNGNGYYTSLEFDYKRPTVKLHLSLNLMPPTACLFPYYTTARVSPDLLLDNSDLDLFAEDSVEYHDYIESPQFNPTCHLSRNLLLNTTEHSPPNATIFHSNFRDKFISEYHLNTSKYKLTSVCDNSSRIISQKTYEYLFNMCNIKYDLNIFSKSSTGFEGFIDNHTYIACTFIKKEKLYYLNTIFSNNEIIKELINNIEFINPPASVSWVTGVHQDGSLDIEKLPIEPPQQIFNSFYPWLGDVTLDDYLDNYYHSDESILLLYGNPGTGKSSILKHLLHKYNESALITYQDDIRDLDKMFSSFLKGEERFLIIEDADEFLTKRENGNTSMKRLLNIADGLTSNKSKKVIFTTNLTNLGSIDSALIREGRCYDTVKFETLDNEQARLVASDLEIDSSLIVNKEYSLAQLFAIKSNKLKLNKPKIKSGFGFKQ